MEIMKSGNVIIATQIYKAFLQLAFIVISIRHIDPRDFGLFALATSILVVFSKSREMGLTTVIIQSINTSKMQKNKLFWLTITLSVGSSFLLMLASLPLSLYFKTPELLNILIIFSFVYLFTSASTYKDALLRKKFLYYKVAKIDIVSSTIGFLFGVFLTLIYGNYIALMVYYFVPLIVHNLMVNFYIKRDLGSFDIKNTSLYIKNGISHALSSIFNQYSYQSFFIIGAYFFTIEDVGGMSRAVIIVLAVPSIIIFPLLQMYFSYLRNHSESLMLNGDRYKIYSIAIVVSIGLWAGISYSSEIISSLLIEDQNNWSSLSQLIEVLSIIIISETMVMVVNTFALSSGKTFEITVIRFLEVCIIVVSMFIIDNSNFLLFMSDIVLINFVVRIVGSFVIERSLK
jgi:O-antigen/teichoic acid export membrane protein